MNGHTKKGLIITCLDKLGFVQDTNKLNENESIFVEGSIEKMPSAKITIGELRNMVATFLVCATKDASVPDITRNLRNICNSTGTTLQALVEGVKQGQIKSPILDRMAFCIGLFPYFWDMKHEDAENLRRIVYILIAEMFLSPYKNESQVNASVKMIVYKLVTYTAMALRAMSQTNMPADERKRLIEDYRPFTLSSFYVDNAFLSTSYGTIVFENSIKNTNRQRIEDNLIHKFHRFSVEPENNLQTRRQHPIVIPAAPAPPVIPAPPPPAPPAIPAPPPPAPAPPVIPAPPSPVISAPLLPEPSVISALPPLTLTVVSAPSPPKPTAVFPLSVPSTPPPSVVSVPPPSVLSSPPPVVPSPPPPTTSVAPAPPLPVPSPPVVATLSAPVAEATPPFNPQGDVDSEVTEPMTPIIEQTGDSGTLELSQMYEWKTVLGIGGFGVVVKATERGEDFAVKICNYTDAKRQDSTPSEVEILEAFRTHAGVLNVVQLVGYVRLLADPSALLESVVFRNATAEQMNKIRAAGKFLKTPGEGQTPLAPIGVMKLELCELGSVFSSIRSGGGGGGGPFKVFDLLSTDTFGAFAVQVLCTLDALERKFEFTHYDLTLANVLMTRYPDSEPGKSPVLVYTVPYRSGENAVEFFSDLHSCKNVVFKLSDFGLSTATLPGGRVVKDHSRTGMPSYDLHKLGLHLALELMKAYASIESEEDGNRLLDRLDEGVVKVINEMIISDWKSSNHSTAYSEKVDAALTEHFTKIKCFLRCILDRVYDVRYSGEDYTRSKFAASILEDENVVSKIKRDDNKHEDFQLRPLHRVPAVGSSMNPKKLLSHAFFRKVRSRTKMNIGPNTVFVKS